MLKIQHLLLPVLFAQNLAAQVPAAGSFIEANNVRAFVRAGGSAFNDGQQGVFVPLQPGVPMKSLVRHVGVWPAGLDPAGNLKGAVSINGATDFRPGIPLLSNPPDPAYMNNIWKVTCADINQHLGDIQDNGMVDNPNPHVFGYPGRGNPYFSEYNPYDLPFTAQGLAGFYDQNGDAGYDPFEGDYPALEIRGCPIKNYPEELNWLVFNDETTHASELAPMKMEVQTQFFAFKTPVVSPLNNAVFARYKLINRGTERVDSCFFGIYADFDIGNPNDDFMGTIPQKTCLNATPI